MNGETMLSELGCQDVLIKLIRHEHLSRLKPKIKLTFWNKRGSCAGYYSHEIRMSRTQLKDNYWARLALVVHEFVHVVVYQKNGSHGILPHGKEFRRIEDRLLKLFGLTIERKKCYAKAFYHNGVEVWREGGYWKLKKEETK